MRIATVTFTPLALRFERPYHWAGRVDHGAAVVLVEVTADTCLTGIGESTAPMPADSTVLQLEAVAPLFIGQPVHDVERLLAEARYLGGFNHVPRTANLILAGLEMALWDLMGKAAEVPAHQLLGGAVRDHVDYFGFPQGSEADELAEDAARLAAAGHDVIYLKVGRGAARDVRNASAVRDAIGDRRLRLDANGAWDVAEAIHMIRLLEPFAPEWIEQPTPPLSIVAMRQVKEAVRVPVAADQAVFTAEDVYEVCCQRAADVIVLSPHETGGLLEFRRATGIARAAGVPICLHGQSVSSISDAAQHHLGLSTANLTQGNQIMHPLLEEDLVLRPRLVPHKGRIGMLEAPGLGVELDREAVVRAAERYRQEAQRGGPE
jgi:muconate cycloisomerase